MGQQQTVQPARRTRAFSLVELLLSVALLLLLMSAVAFNFSSLQRGAQLDEGVTQLEALLRYAKAQAATTGKKVQVRFQESAAVAGNSNQAPAISVQVLWEPDPLGQPGVFEQLPEGNHYAESVNELITIENVQSGNSIQEMAGPQIPEGFQAGLDPEPVTASAGSEGDAKSSDAVASGASSPMPSIEFFPDGSCDTAQITVVSRDTDDTRRTAVRLVGSTGEMKRQPMPGDDSDSAKLSDPAPALSESQ